MLTSRYAVIWKLKDRRMDRQTEKIDTWTNIEIDKCTQRKKKRHGLMNRDK